MSALALRIIACVSMLLDHIGFCFAGRWPFLLPLRWIGRIAFPLYVFLIVNGFRHTSNRLRYALRLAIFAVISQVPFALLFHHKEWLNAIDLLFSQPLTLLTHPGRFVTFNVFVTLLLALLTVWATDEMRKHRFARHLCFLPTVFVYFLYYYGLIRSDYGAKGILLAMTFYLFDGKYVLTALGMLASFNHRFLMYGPIAFAYSILRFLQGKEYEIKPLIPPTKMERIELFCLLSLVFIFLYNGKKGRTPKSKAGAKALQLGFYLFYPVHILLLYALRQLLA